MLQKSRAFSSWSILAKEIINTYGPSVYQSPRYSLLKLVQGGSIVDYYADFTALANCVECLSLATLLDYFIRGLRK